VPRSKINRISPKDTSRADARRRHREEQRALENEPDAPDDPVEPVETASPKRFGLELARQAGAFPEGQVADIATLFIQLTLPPTSLFVFFIGGFVASRASYLVGALLGIFDAILITILVVRDQAALEGSGIAEVSDQQSTIEALVPLWGIAILVGIFAAGFASWYRRFLRSSQERAKANRAIKEQEQAKKAKEQARADKEEARKARRDLSD